MTETGHDPWTAWYETYRAGQTALRQAAMARRERKRAADVMALLLLGYMVLGGAAAGIAVQCVMAH